MISSICVTLKIQVFSTKIAIQSYKCLENGVKICQINRLDTYDYLHCLSSW